MTKSISPKKNDGKKTKSKTVPKAKQPTRRTMLLYLAAGLLVLIILVCSLHRQQIGLKFDKIRYGYSARTGFNAEYESMKEPLSAFGITPNPKSKCIVEEVAQYSEKQLQCMVEEQPYVVIGKDQSSKDYYINQAAKLDQLLKQNGWTEDHNSGPSYKAWITGLTSGKDWYADEGATKNFGTNHCWMDAFLAFSNPQPAAFSLHMGCDSPILQKFKDLPF